MLYHLGEKWRSNVWTLFDQALAVQITVACRQLYLRLAAVQYTVKYE